MSYLCDIFFIIMLIFIVIKYIISLTQTVVFPIHFYSSSQKFSLSVLLFFANFSLALFVKVLLIKEKACIVFLEKLLEN